MNLLKKIFISLLCKELWHAATSIRKAEDILWTGFDSGSEFADYLEQLVPGIREDKFSDKDLFRLWQIFAPTGNRDNLPGNCNSGDFISWLLNRLYGKRLKQIFAGHRVETQNTSHTQTMMPSDQEKLIAELRKLVVDISVIVRRKYERDVQPWPVGFYYLNHFRNVDELRYALQMIYGGIGMSKADSLTDMGFPHLEMMTKIENICREIQKAHGLPEGRDDAILRDFSAQLRHPSEAELEFISTVTNNLNRWNTIVQGTQSCVTANPVIPELVKGDLLNQKVDVIVNAWNRNLIPWWLLLPQGVSGAIKKLGGCAPFKDVAKAGSMPLGSAVLTGAGRLPFRGIIHVAGIDLCWTATEYSVRQSVRTAMEIVNREGFQSVAFPIIGSGSGNRSKKWALDLMLDEFKKIESSARVVIVEFERKDNAHINAEATSPAGGTEAKP